MVINYTILWAFMLLGFKNHTSYYNSSQLDSSLLLPFMLTVRTSALEMILGLTLNVSMETPLVCQESWQKRDKGRFPCDAFRCLSCLGKMRTVWVQCKQTGHLILLWTFSKMLLHQHVTTSNRDISFFTFTSVYHVRLTTQPGNSPPCHMICCFDGL